MSLTRYGIDIAHPVCHLYWVDRSTGMVMNEHIARADFLAHFANHAPCMLGIAAGPRAQELGRRLKQAGHEVKLIPAKVVQSFVGDKRDKMADARAIWLAMQHAGVKAVAVQTEEQEAVQAIEGLLKQMVKCRALHCTALRGVLGEPADSGAPAAPAAPAAPVDPWSALLVDTVRAQWDLVGQLDQHIAHLEQRLPR